MLKVRDYFTVLKLRKAAGVNIEESLTTEELYERMRHYNFSYPGIKEYSFAGGELFIIGNFKHLITINSENELSVSVEKASSTRREAKKP